MIEQYCEEDPNSHRIEELEKRWESEIDELNNEAA
jgi:hypothetical protein